MGALSVIHTGTCGSICFSSTNEFSIAAVPEGLTDKTLGLQIESLLDPIDHRLRGIVLFGAVRGGRLNIDDDAGADVD